MPCSKEEGDDGMLIYIRDSSHLGYRKIAVVTVDTNVPVILLYAFWDIYPLIEKLWIDYGESKDRKWIPVHIYAKTFGEEIYRALLFWYGLAKYGTVSEFLGYVEK